MGSPLNRQWAVAMQRYVPDYTASTGPVCQLTAEGADCWKNGGPREA